MIFIRFTEQYRPGVEQCKAVIERILNIYPGGVSQDDMLVMLRKTFTQEVIDQTFLSLSQAGKIEEVEVTPPPENLNSSES